MTEGYIKVPRSIWTDDLFKDEPLSEREAFLWLVAEAAYKPCQRRVGNVVVTLQRGQMAASTRFMARAWQWPQPRVRRFLSRLQNRLTIDSATDSGVTVVTICKYDEFQGCKRDADSPAESKATQQRLKLKEGNTYSAKAESAEAPSMAQIIFSRGVALMVRLGVSDRQARAILGKWRKLHGDGAVFEALKRIHNESPLDPVAFGEGCFRGRKANAPPSLDEHGIPEVDDAEPDFSRGRDTRRPALRHTADNVPGVLAHSAQAEGPLLERDVSGGQGAGSLLALRAWGGVQ